MSDRVVSITLAVAVVILFSLCVVLVCSHVVIYWHATNDIVIYFVNSVE